MAINQDRELDTNLALEQHNNPVLVFAQVRVFNNQDWASNQELE